MPVSYTHLDVYKRQVYEDMHGTHIFANNDLDMMTKLSELVEHGFDHWKLDGVYCPGENFVKITEYFVKARDLIEAGEFSQDQADVYKRQVLRRKSKWNGRLSL